MSTCGTMGMNTYDTCLTDYILVYLPIQDTSTQYLYIDSAEQWRPYDRGAHAT